MCYNINMLIKQQHNFFQWQSLSWMPPQFDGYILQLLKYNC